MPGAKRYPGRLPALLLAATLVAGCEEPEGTDRLLGVDEIAESRILNATLHQVDRFGLPAVNTAFVAASADKNAFNLGVPADDEADFSSTLEGVIMARYGLSAGQAADLADFVLPDLLPFGDLSGFPNGRRLTDDVIDVELGLIFGVFGPAVPALQSDGVDGNDVAFLGRFPYLAAPHE